MRDEGRTEREERLAEICRQYDVVILYAFGSRGKEVWEWITGRREYLAPGPSDVDIGVKARPGRRLSVREKVELALALEDFFGVDRVDLVAMEDADPFLALDVVREYELYAEDSHLAAEYELYVLRRAGDLAPLERERQELILHTPVSEAVHGPERDKSLDEPLE